ncbi:MAG: hypothetical protein M0Z56_12095 [Desulfobacteraceae bacterium]|nr:hypothetical protein [Desulfobacteraceae bacterium]
MRNKDKIQILGNAIKHLMNRGVTLDGAALHYIDSTFSYPGAEDLRQILLDVNAYETGTLYELIFFPDMEMQEQLEPVLEAHVFIDSDIEAVITFIQQKKSQTRIRFPDSRGELSVHPPDATVRRLIERLKITATVDARILKTVQETVPEASDARWIRVMLRNCRVPFSEPSVEVLRRCIEIMYPASAYFRPAFAFLLEFLEAANPSKDIYAGLIHQKQIFGHMIFQAERNEHTLKKTNVEALMLAGVRIPAIAVGEARKKIALIDHICLSIYGVIDMTGY